MSRDHRKNPAPPVTASAPAKRLGPTHDVLPPVGTSPPAVAPPEALVDAMRHLQQMIPGFTHLSVREKRSHSRAANLDPEFIEAGLHAAVVWPQTQTVVKRSGEQLREEQDEIRRWDELVVELRAFIDGVDAANTKRKHRLGQAILMIYRILGACVERPGSSDAQLRPYYENMKRAYLRTGQFRRRKERKTL